MVEKAKRERVLVKEFYVNGEWQSRADEGATEMRFTFVGLEDQSKSYKLEDFPQSIQTAFAWHGLSQKAGDSASSPSGTDPEDRLSGFESCMDALIDGVWSERREGHALPRTQLFEAICRLNQEAQGSELSVEQRATIATKINEMDQESKKAAGKNPQVALIVDQLREEARKKRTKRLKEDAKGQETPTNLLFV